MFMESAVHLRLYDLPLEILSLILSQIDGISLCHIQLASRKLYKIYHEIIATHILWRKICYNEISPNFIAEFAKNIDGKKLNPYRNNVFWQNLYQSWCAQKRMPYMKYRSMKPLIKKMGSDNMSNNVVFPVANIDIVTKAIIKDHYIITGHESGCVCQWEVSNIFTNSAQPNSMVTLVKHQSGAVREMLLLNPYDSIYLASKSCLIISVAQDNVVKICSTLAGSFDTVAGKDVVHESELSTISEGIISYTIIHPTGSMALMPNTNIHRADNNIAAREASELKPPFITTLCAIDQPFGSSLAQTFHFCVGFRNGFLSLWEYQTVLLYDKLESEIDECYSNDKIGQEVIAATYLTPTVNEVNNNTLKAYLRSVLRAHDSEILHIAYWNGTLATTSIKLELKLWALNLPARKNERQPNSSTTTSFFDKPRFECYHSLILGFHSYQQSLPFGGCFFSAPWNFCFKNDTIVAGNLKILVAVTIANKAARGKTDDKFLADDNSMAGSELKQGSETSIVYKQFRTASKLPLEVENENVATLAIKGNLFAIATLGTPWVLIYYMGDGDFKELTLSEAPCFAKRINFRNEFPDLPFTAFERHGPVHITGLDINFWSCNYVLLTVTTQLGVITYKFEHS